MKETRISSGEVFSSCRYCPEQHGMSGLHCATAKGSRRRKWSQEINEIVMECYYGSNPEVVGYLERMDMIWK